MGISIGKWHWWQNRATLHLNKAEKQKRIESVEGRKGNYYLSVERLIEEAA
jgi:hypothetical protein